MNLKKLNVNFYLFFVIFTLSHINVNAQRAIPEKGDNIILIFGDKLAENNFTSFGKFLIGQGFSFSSNDKEFLSLSTNERTSQGGYKYTLTVSFNDSLILIRPRCNYVLFGSSIGDIKTEWIDWSYEKAKSSSSGIAFKAFEPMLRKYNGKLYFKKEL
ncbi:MAG: hypothetical protein IH597_06555 [Bacteroidales bacterium]|nr:hypothetical protein [Bacteroidales bacterium]